MEKHGYYKCDRCGRDIPAYYVLSHLTKGLYVKCPLHGTHARSFTPNLDIPLKPSKAYKEQVMRFQMG